MLYFPKAQTPGGALSNLNFWIRRCTDLYAALRACGMARKAKAYTPKEVALIAFQAVGGRLSRRRQSGR